jgi:hypothetical protein
VKNTWEWVSSHGFYLMLNVGVFLCILFVALLTIDLVRHWTLQPPVQVVYSNQKTEVTDALETFKTRFDDQEKLLDKLAALTGIYTLILGAAAWAGLADARSKAEAKYADLSAKIEQVRSDIPSVYALNRRVEDVLRTIRDKLPPETNVTLEDSYKALTPQDRQTLLVSEMRMAALDVFDLAANTSTRVRAAELYYGLARFYLMRSLFEDREQSQARMKLHLARVRELQDTFLIALSHRLEGMMYLLNYQAEEQRQEQAAKKGQSRNPLLLRGLLDDMKGCFTTAIRIDENEAGAWYNLAYAVGVFEEQPLAAINLLQRLVDRRDSVVDYLCTKFLPDSCQNIACFHMRHLASIAAKRETTPALRRRHEADALQACRLGKQLAGQYGALDGYLKALQAETKPSGDLVVLERFYPMEMMKICSQDEYVDQKHGNA